MFWLDNVIEDNIKDAVEEFDKSDAEACVFLKEAPDPERFGVPVLDGDKIVKIEEKPKKPKSRYAVTGVYMYAPIVFDIIETLKPSARGEYGITDVNNAFIKRGTLTWKALKRFWSDAGTFDSLYRATTPVRKKNGKGL